LTGERVERRLAAVLAADVAGYSCLEGRDEERTVANLKSFRKTLVDPAIAAAGEYEAAYQSAEQLIRFRPDKFVACRYRAAALGQLDRIEEAKQALQPSIGLLPGEYNFYVQARPAWIVPQQHARLLEGLRKAGLPE
jgi:hypothetical protein